MFTGIIEEVGTVKSIVKGISSAKITINANKVLEDVKIGDSICTNGVCLTVAQSTKASFTVDVMPETMRRSNLKNLNSNSKVNLERALKANGRLGGHFVLGHIDDVGIITNIEKEDNAVWLTIKADINVLKYCIKKGSIAIDGISLTVADVKDEYLKVSIIPLTKQETTLALKKAGEEVNLESDMIGKYIERFTKLGRDNSDNEKKISLNFLRKNGF